MTIESLGKSFASEADALAALKNEVARLETQQRIKEEERLKQLAGEFGLESVDALIRRLADYASPALRKQLQGEAGEVRGKRARVTQELKAQVVADLQAGGTASAVAEKFGVSLPTVQNIKKAAGLVKARRTK
ncbi:MAG: helix-turn-helix domain-containing protein [Cephaloticoccus sp.]|nr:helix-turn-helix domain-containing protein [Cephaloticoccus sp.]MCF7759247.1 helix-turn-helix domain-containing protein [Cephaloticoccus sp.]